MNVPVFSPGGKKRNMKVLDMKEEEKYACLKRRKSMSASPV
jgi:hypothetical protein